MMTGQHVCNHAILRHTFQSEQCLSRSDLQLITNKRRLVYYVGGCCVSRLYPELPEAGHTMLVYGTIPPIFLSMRKCVMNDRSWPHHIMS